MHFTDKNTRSAAPVKLNGFVVDNCSALGDAIGCEKGVPMELMGVCVAELTDVSGELKTRVSSKEKRNDGLIAVGLFALMDGGELLASGTRLTRMRARRSDKRRL
jgi:hypothetical protein